MSENLYPWVNIFPNLARDGNTSILVFPDMIGATVKVYDSQGRKIQEWNVQGRLRTYQFQWGAGIYFFEFRKGSMRELKKIVIVR